MSAILRIDSKCSSMAVFWKGMHTEADSRYSPGRPSAGLPKIVSSPHSALYTASAAFSLVSAAVDVMDTPFTVISQMTPVSKPSMTLALSGQGSSVTTLIQSVLTSSKRDCLFS